MKKIFVTNMNYDGSDITVFIGHYDSRVLMYILEWGMCCDVPDHLFPELSSDKFGADAPTVRMGDCQLTII